MAFQPILQRGARLPLRAALLTGGSLYFATSTVHAEVDPETYQAKASRKPIYDNDFFSTRKESEPSVSSSATSKLSSLIPGRSSSDPTTSSQSQEESSTSRGAQKSPTPTDRLAAQIKRARLFLHAHAALAEDKVNDGMTSFLNLESSFTSTLASLAPPKESGERLMPGAIYVLVAAMAGSIISRNRNILLRASVPAAVGIAAGWVVLPITMRNVGDLVWKYEERVPVVRNNHMRIRGFSEEAWKVAKARGEGAAQSVDEKLRQGRHAVEDWVKKGK
ncbi:MAG: hypothetical protein M4579_003874 [Chaenotheca gracillima]|nr:MAG: hypothetical protein M4579_003874 [Chaenotheca gracillima]